jgi:hypothetical protein
MNNFWKAYSHVEKELANVNKIMKNMKHISNAREIN